MLEDPLFWVLVLPGLLLGLYAQSRIKLNVAKYSQVPTQNGITGAEVARRLLDAQGLHDVAVESTPGVLSDHYDPRAKRLRLSQQVSTRPVWPLPASRRMKRDMRSRTPKTTFPWRREPTSCRWCNWPRKPRLGCLSPALCCSSTL